jgi:outer membrane protein assembly factor BamB
MLVLAVIAGLVALARAEPQAEQPRDGIAARLADALLIRLEPGGGLGALTRAWGDVWANDYERETLVRLDGGNGRVLARLPLGRRVALAADRRSVWALRWGGRFWRRPNGPLYRIDPATNRVVARIALRGPSGRPMIGFGVLADERGVWVWGPSRALRLEPSSGRVLREFGVGERHGELTGAVLHAGGLLAATADGHLVRFDGLRGTREGARQPALAAAQLQGAAGWRVYAAAAGTLLAVDASTGRLLWRRPLGFRVSSVLETGGILLAHGAAFHDPGDRVWALDPATGRVLASRTVPSFGTTSMTTVDGALWLATTAGEVIVVPRLLTRLFLARARAYARQNR